MHHSFFKGLLFCLTLVLFASCDKDFNEIGSDIVDDDHYGLDKDESVSVVAYNQFTGAVQTNKVTSSSVNVPVNALGYYNSTVFGKTKASFITQLELGTINPTFQNNVVVKKVELIVPYFATLDATDDDGNHSYVLDSIKGNGKINLKVYASDYYLRDLDPATGFQEAQRYYSDQKSDFDGSVGTLLNDDPEPSQNTQFFFNPAEIVTYKEENGVQVVDTRTAPQMQLLLNKAFFQERIFGASASGKLVNNNVFKEYLRGIYFQVDAAAGSSEQGTMGQLNFKNGKILITYDADTSSSDNTPIERTFTLNLAGNTVNVFENEDNPSYLSAVTNPDPVNGDQRLYLKGGAGSIAVIELFGTADEYHYDDDNNLDTPDDLDVPNVLVTGANGVPDQLDDIREQKWQVNEANLTFYIDKDKMASAVEPERIYLYDLNNKRPLVDYYSDVTTNSAKPKRSKYIHGGIIEKDDDEHGIRYRIRLTNHIRNLVKAGIDSTNVKLGLVVTETIANVSNARLKTAISPTLDRVPAASVSNITGTVVYGNRPVPGQEDKKLKLVIYYTKPD